jgi:hypothetical protein
MARHVPDSLLVGKTHKCRQLRDFQIRNGLWVELCRRQVPSYRHLPKL